jgi:hypothetical protein
MSRRNVQHWFLCGLIVGAMIGLTVGITYGVIVVAAGVDFRAYPALLTAVIFGGSCWLLKRDNQGHGLRRVRSEYCFISKERKARIEDLY